MPAPKKRIFVFKQRVDTGRPLIWGIPEDKIDLIETQLGSQAVYLSVNGKSVEGTFEDLVNKLGEGINIL